MRFYTIHKYVITSYTNTYLLLYINSNYTATRFDLKFGHRSSVCYTKKITLSISYYVG
jgi:hypothetical protein